jgi:hypothetical protein
LEKARERETLFSALTNEARRYEFSNRASRAVLPVSSVVDSAIDVVFNQSKRLTKAERQAILIVEGAAEYLFSKYNVTSIDQRQSQRRAAVTG